MTIFSSLQDAEVVRALRNGGVGILPTDTIYGIVARAEDPAAVDKLNRVKHREHKSGTIIAADVDQILRLGINESHLHGAEQYWPASLSVEVPVADQLNYLARDTGAVAVRIPASPEIRAFLAQTGPLFTSSANLPGQPHATTLKEAQAYFGDEVDFYVEGGTVAHAAPSTVIRFAEDGSILIRRQGAVRINQKES